MVYHHYGSPDVFQEKPDRTDQMRCRVGQASELALFFRENPRSLGVQNPYNAIALVIIIIRTV